MWGDQVLLVPLCDRLRCPHPGKGRNSSRGWILQVTGSSCAGAWAHSAHTRTIWIRSESSLSVTRTHSRAYLKFLQPTAELAFTRPMHRPAQRRAEAEEPQEELCQDQNVPSWAHWIFCCWWGRWLVLNEKQQKPLWFQVLPTERIPVDRHPCPLATDSICLRKCSHLECMIPSYWE